MRIERALAGRAVRGAFGVLAIALAGVLIAALVSGWRAAKPEGWWADGYHRLVVDAVCERFDDWAPRAAAGAVVLGLGLSLLRRHGRAGRLAPVVVALVLGLRVAVAVDAWYASGGPNVVLISIDTLRADRLGAYGYDLATSPTFDRRLAAEGVTFEEVWSQSPKTTPSHMTLLTSLYPCVHGINLWWGDAPAHVLRPAVHTLAEVLKDAGYVTVAFTGGGHVDKSRGFAQGFDRYSHMQELDKALPWLDKHHRRKFFLFFHTYLVHDPYVHPLDYVKLFAADYHGPVLAAVQGLLADEQRLTGNGTFAEERDKRFWGSVDKSDPNEVRFVSHLYDAGIRRMDETMLRPLLDRLDTLGLAKDTLVVFTSDHGEEFNEHGKFRHNDLYAETLRVPLVLRFPGRHPAGVRVPGPARLIDVMPTILDLLHIAAPKTLQGQSLVTRIGRPSDGEIDVVSEYSAPWAGWRFEALRRGTLSYAVEGSTEHLFDLARDPGEREDVASSHTDEVAALRAALARWREECGSLAPRFGPDDRTVKPSAERTRQLRALGYVE